MIPRVHAFEFNELAACPALIRETIVEALGAGLRWGRIYDEAGAVFADFCRQSGASRVLDLCSGSGEPVAILLEALGRRGLPLPRFALSDLLPNLPAMEGVARRFPDLIDVIHEPVDATAVPAAIDRPARTIVSAFHHFPPAIAARILQDAVASRRAIFILEPATRSPRFLATLPIIALTTATAPLRSPRDRLRRALFTWLLPAVPAAGVWDAVISMLRMYTREELRAMVAASAATYTWTFAEAPFALGGRAVCFYGVPRPS